MKAHWLAPLLRDRDTQWALVEQRSGQVLATAITTAFDSASRRRGLLAMECWPAGAALIIAPCQAVHTVGMRFAIDVMFVNRIGRVVRVRERVRPWRVVAAIGAFAAVELPAGTLAGAVQPGDVLSMSGGEIPPPGSCRQIASTTRLED